MLSLLDSIVEAHGSGANAQTGFSENHNVGSINWVAGLSDPGEMIGCGRYQQLRRLDGEEDGAYQIRIEREMASIPVADANKIRAAMVIAATKRASLDVTNGRVSLMVAGKLPWHGLGVNVASAVNSADAIRLAGLNWSVEKHQLSYVFNGETRKATDQFSIVRQDTGACLGSVGARYKPIQNDHGFDYLDSVLSQFGARYESAGALYGGKQVFMLAHLPAQAFTVNGTGDAVEPFVIFTNCHDGSGAAACYPTSVRVVCANTFRTSRHDKKKGISIRHTGNVKDKVNAAKEALGLAVESFTEFKTDAEALYHKRVEFLPYANNVLDVVLEMTQARASMGAALLASHEENEREARERAEKKFAQQIERRAELLADIIGRYESGKCATESAIGDNGWRAFNAFSEHADHNQIGRQATDVLTRQSRRFESVIQGDADELKQVAMEYALKV